MLHKNIVFELVGYVLPKLLILMIAVLFPAYIFAQGDVDANTLMLLKFENSLNGEQGEMPNSASGVSFQSGIRGQSGLFGLSNEVYYPSANNINALEGTIEFWLKPTWSGNDNLQHTLIQWGGGGGIYVTKDGGNYLKILLNRFGAFPGGEQGVSLNVVNWQANRWRYIAFTYSNTQKKLRLFINGSLVSETTFTSELPAISAADFQIGGEGSNDSISSAVDELRISDIARTPQEIFNRYYSFNFITPGDLDPTFNGNGKVITPIGTNTVDFIYDVAVQPDAKIVAVGAVGFGDFAVLRYNSDGSPDTNFGTNGIVTTNFGSNDAAWKTAIQPDGKILVSGNRNNIIVLARYNTDGTLDSGFGSSGFVTTTIIGSGTAMFLQSNGKFVVGGYVGSSFNARNYAVARFNSDGSLDTTFGGGVVVTDVSGSAKADIIGDVAVQVDGKIIAGGASYVESGDFGSFYSDFSLVRYNIDGTLDTNFASRGTNFGTNGIVITPVSTFTGQGVKDDFINALTIQSDGKIMVAGQTTNVINGYDFGLARYNTNGSLDTEFNSTGILVADGGTNDTFRDIKLDGIGRIVAFGSAYTNRNNFALFRYNPNGTPDAGFGENGRIITSIPNNIYGFGATIQPDGKIVGAGYLQPASGGQDAVVVRYLVTAPTAAAASISGRILTFDGRGISKTSVLLTNSNSITRTTTTSSFGYFRFDDVSVGETYVIDARHKMYNFSPQVINFNEEILDFNFVEDK